MPREDKNSVPALNALSALSAISGKNFLPRPLATSLNFIFPSIKNINMSNKNIYKNFKYKLNVLPNLAFIGVGKDGHIASIFFNDFKIQYTNSKFLIC